MKDMPPMHALLSISAGISCNLKPLYKSYKLFRGNFQEFLLSSWPLEPFFIKAHRKKKKAARLPQKPFDPVCFSSAKQIQCSRFIGILTETIVYNSGKAIYSLAEVSPAESDKDFLKLCGICVSEHLQPPPLQI